jgi:hypothetical protein
MNKLTSLALLFSIVLVLNEIYSSEALGQRLSLYNKLKARQTKRTSAAAVEEEYENMNTCILACVKCAGDLYANDDAVIFFFLV